MSDKGAFITRWVTAYARAITSHPGKTLLLLLALGVFSAYLTSKLTLESDQLALISQDLDEVKEGKRVIGSVGQKSIRHHYNNSDDRQMMMILMKRMWNSTELQENSDFIQ